jgi:hypothetical protein
MGKHKGGNECFVKLHTFVAGEGRYNLPISDFAVACNVRSTPF